MNQYVVVLPGGITKSGKLPFFAKHRLDNALQYFHAKSPKKIVVCGRWSPLLPQDPPSTEAAAMSEYLQRLGLSPFKIIREEHSFDLVSSVYYLKTRILLPRRVYSVRVVTHEIQEERTRYVFNKVLGPSFEIDLCCVPSMMSPDTLWEFYSYEERAGKNIRTYLKPMKRGDHGYLAGRIASKKYCEKFGIGYPRLLVYEEKTGQPSTTLSYYSLKNIQKKKGDVYAQYFLSEQKKVLNVDTWSGRYLNFYAKNPEGACYTLKFVLHPNDKPPFLTEILLTDALRKNGIRFVPEIAGKNIARAPVWCLYTIISGVPAGIFSGNLAFRQSFYKPWVIRSVVTHLKSIRSADSGPVSLRTWDSALYRRRLARIVSQNRTKKAFQKPEVARSVSRLFSRLKIFDTATPVLCHADLHPSNIILASGEKSLYFIDFEHACYNTVVFDFCFFYLFSWDSPEFQKTLKTRFFMSLTDREKTEFTALFDDTFAFFLIWLLNYVERWNGRTPKERRSEGRRYIFTHLKKYAAGRG